MSGSVRGYGTPVYPDLEVLSVIRLIQNYGCDSVVRVDEGGSDKAVVVGSAHYALRAWPEELRIGYTCWCRGPHDCFILDPSRRSRLVPQTRTCHEINELVSPFHTA